MELKWLEDFLSLARTGSFSRSAVERHVTQPAFGRRIRALEGWLGVALVDRSTYPTALTPEGRLFLETAEETVRRLHGSRDALRARIRPPPRTVSVAALHTLALTVFPRWFRDVEARTGPLGSRLLPDDFHACVQALAEGGYDLLLTYHHPLVPIPSTRPPSRTSPSAGTASCRCIGRGRPRTGPGSAIPGTRSWAGSRRWPVTGRPSPMSTRTPWRRP